MYVDKHTKFTKIAILVAILVELCSEDFGEWEEGGGQGGEGGGGGGGRWDGEEVLSQ